MRNVRIIAGGSVIFFALLITGCDKKVGKYPAADPTAVNCDSVSYAKDIKPILEQSCAKGGCHDAVTRQSDIEFTSYGDAKTQADLGRIKARVIDGTPSYMPADVGRLPETQIKKIQCWLDKGAPNN
jgi:hypothetical protein